MPKTSILHSENFDFLNYPFGMELEGRTYSSSGYKFGFNGQMKDNEIYGEGNTYSAQYWEYDSRLGRRWNLDPVDQISISNYACFGDNPIAIIDPNGDTPKEVLQYLLSKITHRYKWTGNLKLFGESTGRLTKKGKINNVEEEKRQYSARVTQAPTNRNAAGIVEAPIINSTVTTSDLVYGTSTLLADATNSAFFNFQASLTRVTNNVEVNPAFVSTTVNVDNINIPVNADGTFTSNPPLDVFSIINAYTNFNIFWDPSKAGTTQQSVSQTVIAKSTFLTVRYTTYIFRDNNSGNFVFVNAPSWRRGANRGNFFGLPNLAPNEESRLFRVNRIYRNNPQYTLQIIERR